ncbi:non-hydrolyzing UDP-N-acetylglucosamine 2-epimerase [Mesorhizobium sp. UC22_110]|uniref:non-hydrolyzing UDP-N-acetylglucosamine 2-epimerase n=1 Tax=unclassified Mesorhizobium TaxID=325217 RepID=UPI00366F64D1
MVAKIVTVVGARPQFVKSGIVAKAVAKHSHLKEILVHTGQHFDANMSDVFFEQLGIPRPNHLLDIHGGSHGEMTGRMLVEIERILLAEKPDRVLVYGDTNSTLAGALAAIKLHIPVAHVEAGLRSFNMEMPEEVNRILTDQVSDVLFCPTETAVQNLEAEGFGRKAVSVINAGDVMQDSAIAFASKAARPLGLQFEGGFIIATLHRAENTDSRDRLAAIVQALNEVQRRLGPVVLPLHPRTRKAIENHGLKLSVTVIDPVGYLEMLWLLSRCELVITDSGGVQKEAFFFGKFCVTMRDQTEWTELVKIDANVLAGANEAAIVAASVSKFGTRVVDDASLYGGGHAAIRIADELVARTV